MKTTHLLTVTAGVTGALLALPALRADPAGGAQVVQAAYWISGNDYGNAMDRRLPDSQNYSRSRPAPVAPAATQPKAFRTSGDTSGSFDSPVFTPHPIGWDDPAAPAIPQLPAFNVTDSRIREIQPPELYTRQGMIYESYRNHPGLVYGNFFHSNDHQAQEMYREEHWNDTKADYWQTAFAMAVGGDLKEARLIKQDVYDEDLRMRSDAEAGDNVPQNGQLEFGSQDVDSKLLAVVPIFPVNFPLVQVKW